MNERLSSASSAHHSRTQAAATHTRTVPLHNVVAALVDAALHQRGWLDDFGEEPIVVSADLHEILMAYQAFRVRDAA